MNHPVAGASFLAVLHDRAPERPGPASLRRVERSFEGNSTQTCCQLIRFLFLAAAVRVALRCLAPPRRRNDRRTQALHPQDTGVYVNRATQAARTGIALLLNRNLEIALGTAEFFRKFGGAPGELCGRRFHGLVAPSLREPLASHLTQLFSGAVDQFTSRIVVPRQAAPPLTGVLTATALRGSRPGSTMAVLFIRTAEGTTDGINEARSLNELEGKILEGIAAGLTSEVLASRLFISRQTVEYHIGRLLRKLSVSNRVALVARAYSLGVLEMNVWPPRIVDDAIK